MRDYSRLLRQFKHQPAWKRQVLTTVVDLMLLHQVVVDLYFAFCFNFLFARRRIARQGWELIKLVSAWPLPVRVGLFDTLITFLLIVLAPSPYTMPVIALPIFMAAAFSLAVTLAVSLPRVLRAHWLTA